MLTVLVPEPQHLLEVTSIIQNMQPPLQPLPIRRASYSTTMAKEYIKPIPGDLKSPKRLTMLPPVKSLSPSPRLSLPPPAIERSMSVSTADSTPKSITRRNSCDTVDFTTETAQLSELEELFLKAVSHNNNEVVLKCLKEKVNIDVQNGFKRDAMQIAARNGSIAMLELLSQNGASINTKGMKGDTLYQLAASNGSLSVVKWLLKNGLVDVPDRTGNTAVHVATRRSELEILKFLDVSMGYDFRLRNNDGQTPYECIPRFGDDSERIGKCRELVKSIVTEAERQEKEEKMGVIKRRASLSPVAPFPNLYHDQHIAQF